MPRRQRSSAQLVTVSGQQLSGDYRTDGLERSKVFSNAMESFHANGGSPAKGIEEEMAQATESSCDNCGVRATDSICSRCLELPACRQCKRHLPYNCFNVHDPTLCQACEKKNGKVRSSVGDIITEIEFETTEADRTFEGLIERTADQIRRIVDDYQQRFRSIRVHMRIDALFSRHNQDGEEMHVPAFFVTLPQDIDGGRHLDLHAVTHELDLQTDNWNSRGSGFVLEYVTKFVMCISKFRPLHGSSFIETPECLQGKHCVVNVQNADNKCFLWAVLSAIHPPSSPHAERISHYLKYEKELKIDKLNFPMTTKQLPRFESMNSEISVNVLAFGDSQREFCIEYLSPHRNRTHHVNLFLIEKDGKSHYVWVKNMSRLVGDRTKHDGQTYVCNSCLHPFSNKAVLERHIPYCLRHPPQAVKYPDPQKEDKCKVKFRDYHKQHRLPFYLVCDFESFLTPVNDNASSNATRVIDEHHVSGFACHRVTDFPEFQTKPTVYSGPDVMSTFYDHIMKESEEISQIIAANKDMIPLTPQQQAEYNQATACFACGNAFSENNWKVRHHCHISGNFLFSACNNCNLQLKMVPGKRKSKTKYSKAKKCRKVQQESDDETDDDDDDEDEETSKENEYFIPVVFHNLKSYDAHFVIKHFEKKYTEKEHKNGNISYDDVNVIPINSEKYVMFEIGKLRFVDSFQFLSTSLENLVSILLKSGKDKFPNTLKFLGDDDNIFVKGVFPYSFMTSRDKFEETALPPIESFYDTLNDEALKPVAYERAKAIWTRFEIKNMQQYHDLYLLSDVLLLSDVFQNFRNSVMEQHKLDCLHYLTLPSLAWGIALKYTKAELDLLTDPDAYLMIENSMRGGIATISTRHAEANNPQVGGYDDTKPTTWITYLDANNLYGGAMSETLPIGNFRFLNDVERTAFQLDRISADSEIGYIIECDLEYPTHLHDMHSDYPLAPEHLIVEREMLSQFTASLVDEHWKPSQKLIPNLLNKEKYVCHYRNLQFYVRHGMVVTNIHRILAFKQGAWLKPWIDHCTIQRMQSGSEFEADLAKLQANATFGKTMEQVRHRVNVRLISDQNKLTKAVSKVSFRQSEIINKDLVMVRGARQTVTLNKPITVGFTILELSKLIMYEFYYDHLKAKYGDKCRLLFTDTDSLCCKIQTEDLHADMADNLHLYDTSNFEQNHMLYSMHNHRVLGKFKSETGSLPPKEFVGLRAKMYSLHVPDSPKQCKIRAKGIKKSYVKNKVRHQQYLRVLKIKKPTDSTFRTFQSRNHVVHTVEIKKTCLSAFDDKRYVLDDGVQTLAYGHKDIM